MVQIRKAISTPYKKSERYDPRNEGEKLLVEALSNLKSQEVVALLRDMLTLAEIEEFANRVMIVKLLGEGLPYLEVSKKVGVSTTTVTRVAHWLYNCLLYTSPSPRDGLLSRMPSSA